MSEQTAVQMAEAALDELATRDEMQWTKAEQIFHAASRLWYQVYNGGFLQYVDNGYWTGEGGRESGLELLVPFLRAERANGGPIAALAEIVVDRADLLNDYVSPFEDASPFEYDERPGEDLWALDDALYSIDAEAFWAAMLEVLQGRQQ